MDENRVVPAVIGTGIVVTLLYALFIMGAVDIWALTVGPLLLAYFAWRLVRALEKIADAIEASG
mgnify:CR=1 FL=1|jgi:hypothetical protein